MNYILDSSGEPKHESDLMTWGRWFEKTNRTVGMDFVGKARVSTVFLGIDHSFGEGGRPILWETMIFGGPHDNLQWRYESREDAIEGHAKALALVKGSANGSA